MGEIQEEIECPNCKIKVKLVCLGQERGAVTDLKIDQYGCPKYKTIAKSVLASLKFQWGFD